MEQPADWISNIIAIGGVLGTLVTAIATIFLWRVTKVLANETTRMVQAASQPHVVVTIEPNRWSLRHFDLKVDNTGNATAYDISIDFDPPLENGEARGGQLEIPLNAISVLKPGQGMSSYLSEYAPLKNKAYTISVSWRRDPQSQARENNTYKLDIANVEGISQLGSDPIVQIAEHIKKMQESLKPIASGSKRIKVDTFNLVIAFTSVAFSSDSVVASKHYGKTNWHPNIPKLRSDWAWQVSHTERAGTGRSSHRNISSPSCTSTRTLLTSRPNRNGLSPQEMLPIHGTPLIVKYEAG